MVAEDDGISNRMVGGRWRRGEECRARRGQPRAVRTSESPYWRMKRSTDGASRLSQDRDLHGVFLARPRSETLDGFVKFVLS